MSSTVGGRFRTLSGLMGAVAYLLVGVAVYTTIEEKECDAPAPVQVRQWWALQKPTPPPPCREPWTVVDEAYFCMVSMSTVGYGDLSPSSSASSLFTIVYAFVGISVVFVQVSSAASGPLMSARTAVLRIADRFDRAPIGIPGRTLGLSGQPVDIDGNGAADFILPPSSLVFWTQELLFIVSLMTLTQLGSAAVFMLLQPDLSFAVSLYHCIVTATTIGYGDIALTTQSARLFASVHILFSVTWLAALISHVQELTLVRARQLQRADLLRKQLDVTLIASLDQDGLGVDKLEFVVGMLVTLGCEVCGEPLSWDDVRPFLVKFEALDATRTGRINKQDLELMVQQSKEKRQRTSSIYR